MSVARPLLINVSGLTTLASLGFVLSAVCICVEYQRLGIHFRQFRVLRMSFWIKLAFIIVEVGLAIGMWPDSLIYLLFY